MGSYDTKKQRWPAHGPVLLHLQPVEVGYAAGAMGEVYAGQSAMVGKMNNDILTAEEAAVVLIKYIEIALGDKLTPEIHEDLKRTIDAFYWLRRRSGAIIRD